MIYYIIAVDVLAVKASAPKYASVISKKSQTISVIWFKELAWTAQKAALHPERGGGGQKKHAGGMRDRGIATNFASSEEILIGKKRQKTKSTTVLEMPQQDIKIAPL